MTNFIVLMVLTLAFVVQVLSTESQPEGESITSWEDGNKFEGDIVLTSLDKVNQRETGGVDGEDAVSQSKRNAQRYRHLLWTNKIIPYVLDIEETSKPSIMEAFEVLHNLTCVKFVNRTTEKNYLFIFKGDGCYSYVGRAKPGGQRLSLGKGCLSQSTIIHELIHALGFWHEQSRPDRDEYVEVFWENIRDGIENNFEKYSHGFIDTLKTPYDFGSVMHYGEKYFSKNGKPTILGYGANKNMNIGQRYGLSKTDIYKINSLYDCSSSVNGSGWGSWSDFGPCSKECTKTRQRFCSSTDRSSCPDANKYGIQDEHETCPHAECNAPIDGHWNRWSSWTSCSSKCYENGYRTRKRPCDEPMPDNGGKYCFGTANEKGRCHDVRRCSLGPDDCEFEKDGCKWSSVGGSWVRTKISVSYVWHSAKQGRDDVTPGFGHKGYYMKPKRGSKFAQLQSTTFPAVPKGRCMWFAYYIQRGVLNVFVVDMINGAKTSIFYKSGFQGERWHITNATILSSHDYKIVFEALDGLDIWGLEYISLDDIIFKDGECKGTVDGHWGQWTAFGQCSVTCGIGSHTRTRTCIYDSEPDFYGKSCDGYSQEVAKCYKRKCSLGPNDCEFVADTCKWSQVDPGMEYKWKRHSGKGNFKYTGPSGDISQGGYNELPGYYIVAMAYEGHWQQIAQLQSEIFPRVPDGRCMLFAYNMYGHALSMGALNVYVVDIHGAIETIFSKSGNQGQRWHRTNATIFSYYNYKIVFEATRGLSFRGDIALDDIFFKDGVCNQEKQALDCDFEVDMCNWTPASDKIWLRSSQETPSKYTGPPYDHTTGEGYYIHMEANSIDKDHHSLLTSPKVFSSNDMCFSFYYHMYGKGMGSLKVIIRGTRGDDLLFRKSGNQGNKWHKHLAKIPAARYPYKIVFEVARRKSAKSDIALDDISFYNRPC